MNRTDADIIAEVRSQFRAAPPEKLGVAVSGGGDSVALLHILSRCFSPDETELFAATVNHGLRPESKQEADDVADLAEQMGISHATLRWRNWDGEGNLQDQARQARYRLLSDWAKQNGIAVLVMGHTADDQAETFLMRLARSSGVNGLAAMPVQRTLFGVTVMRPLLRLTRAELRSYLEHNKIAWAEDPSNDDTRFDRIKMRQALKVLEPLGVTPQTLSDVAQNMAQAREALDWYSFLAARDVCRVVGGDVAFDLRQFRTLPEETARRLLVRTITWVSGAMYSPRRLPTTNALLSIRTGRSVTLGGCIVIRQGQNIWVCREFNAVRNLVGPVDEIWDGRWRLVGETDSGLEVRALGEIGIAQCPDWREVSRPMAAVMASPSVWKGDELVAAPLANHAGEWAAELIGGEEEFFASLLSH